MTEKGFDGTALSSVCYFGVLVDAEVSQPLTIYSLLNAAQARAIVVSNPMV